MRPACPGRFDKRLAERVEQVAAHNPDQPGRARDTADQGRQPEVFQKVDELGEAPGRIAVFPREQSQDVDIRELHHVEQEQQGEQESGDAQTNEADRREYLIAD